MQSCKNDDSYGYTPEEELTAADLFVASEAYQNFQNEIRKDIRLRRIAISKLSEEELITYHPLKELSYKIETRAAALEKLSALLGYDYEAQLLKLAFESLKVFENTHFTRLELTRARQRYHMSINTISTRAHDPEALAQCNKKCAKDQEDCFEDCAKKFNEEYDALDEKDIKNETEAYQAIIIRKDQCVSECTTEVNYCYMDCDARYGHGN